MTEIHVALLGYLNRLSDLRAMNVLVCDFCKAFLGKDVEWVERNRARITTEFLSHLRGLIALPRIAQRPEICAVLTLVLNRCQHEHNRAQQSAGAPPQPLLIKKGADAAPLPPPTPPTSGPTPDLLLAVKNLLAYEMEESSDLFKETTGKINDDLLALIRDYIRRMEYDEDEENVRWFRRMLAFCEPFAQRNRK